MKGNDPFIRNNSIMNPIEESKKTTKKNVKDKLIRRPVTKEDIARDMFILQYRREYFKKHPGVYRLPDEEIAAAKKKFDQLVKKENSKIVEEYYEKYTRAKAGMDMDLTEKYSIEEVNGDVADPSNKNTMNQTAQPIEESKKTTKKKRVNAFKDEDDLIRRPLTKEDIARDVFMSKYKREYFEKHPGDNWLPDEEIAAAKKKFDQLVKEKNSKIVEEYIEKCKHGKVGMDVDVRALGAWTSASVDSTDFHHILMSELSSLLLLLQWVCSLGLQ